MIQEKKIKREKRGNGERESEFFVGLEVARRVYYFV